jgi:hypothetical protein
MEKFKGYIYSQVWVRRCQDIKKWERDNGIKNNRQKRKVLIIQDGVTVNTDNRDNNKNNNKSYRDKNNIKNICNNLVSKYIIRFVQSNINWTGLYTIGCSAGP